MIRAAAVCCFAAILPWPAYPENRDFNDAVASVERAYNVHRQHIPLMGAVGFCARVATAGAMKGLKIATFDESDKLPANADLPEILKNSLGSAWSLTIQTHDRNGDQAAIYTHPHNGRMTLLIASYDEEGLSIVRADLNAEQLSKWIDHPFGRARHAETD